MTILLGIFLIYCSFGAVVYLLVQGGAIERAPFVIPPVDNSTDSDMVIDIINPSESLVAAVQYVDKNLRRTNGHIDLYQNLGNRKLPESNWTNSEAVSYYMQIMAQQANKTRFDQELHYVRKYMLHPTGGYMMWKLDDKDKPLADGYNIASDADLRALRALYIAKDQWGDQRYDSLIDDLALGLEKVAINDNLLVAYGGMSGEKPWVGDTVFLAYSDFQTLDRLANSRSGVWINVTQRMRNITLEAQLPNGLYYSEYNVSNGRYSNQIDGGVYSINSMWIMVRFAESKDPVLMDSARKSLAFYREKFAADDKIYTQYSASGEVVNKYEGPWAYALVARAAFALDETAFARIMERRMLNYQDLDNSSMTYGAIVEGGQGTETVGQFTMHESILTMQEIQGKAPKFNE
jgi:endo-1,4-beta-D-glucanase Y